MNAIEIAIKMETDAINLYSEAAEKTQNPDSEDWEQPADYALNSSLT